MSWTDERVELLKKLWADGLSASQIAGQLGGVTRNAVIGKVHRLGVSGRAKSLSTSPRPRKARPLSHSMRPRLRYSGNTALAASPDREPAPAPLANIVPMGPRVPILERSEAPCHWPIGDPGTEGFAYCGTKSKLGNPYCPYHARLAYQPLADGRRERRLARS